jgi:hypothetical protein
MKLQGVDWTLSVESESWGLEVSVALKKLGRAHFATILAAGQSSSSSVLVSESWAAVSMKKSAGLLKVNLLCRNDIAIFNYDIDIPVDPKHIDDDAQLVPTWTLPLEESVFNDSSNPQSQAGTALAMLLTNTPLSNLERREDEDEEAVDWGNSFGSLRSLQ